MTCPFCGAREIKYDNHTGFECGSWIGGSKVEQSPPCRELCQLREKKAEGLTWGGIFGYRYADTIHGGSIIVQKSASEGDFFVRNNGTIQAERFETEDAAKAHAEELHQQAWRELRDRWDFKGGGK